MVGKTPPAKFPTIGKTRAEISNDWKKRYQSFQRLESGKKKPTAILIMAHTQAETCTNHLTFVSSLMEQIGDDISQSVPEFTPPDWHIQVLNERRKLEESGEIGFTDWEVAKKKAGREACLLCDLFYQRLILRRSIRRLSRRGLPCG
jgi:hypothetical protein